MNQGELLVPESAASCLSLWGTLSGWVILKHFWITAQNNRENLSCTQECFSWVHPNKNTKKSLLKIFNQKIPKFNSNASHIKAFISWLFWWNKLCTNSFLNNQKLTKNFLCDIIFLCDIMFLPFCWKSSPKFILHVYSILSLNLYSS